MRINGLLARLNTIKRKLGNVRVLVDTEAATFSCHCVEVTRVYGIPKEWVGEAHVNISLDNRAKIHVAAIEKDEILRLLKVAKSDCRQRNWRKLSLVLNKLTSKLSPNVIENIIGRQ